MHSGDIKINRLSRVEGDINLEILIEKNTVKDVKILENISKREYEEVVKGKEINSVPFILSRICGTCGNSHLICSIKSIEKALDYDKANYIENVRKLINMLTIFRDHLMHILFFTLPDVFNKESFFELDEKILKKGVLITDITTEIINKLALNIIHTPLLGIGKLSRKVNPEEILKILKENFENIKEILIELMYILKDWNKEINIDEKFACIDNNYDYYSSDFLILESEKYKIEEFYRKFVLSEKREYFTGALARLNILKNKLEIETKDEIGEFLKCFPSNNIILNNLAQLVENYDILYKVLSILGNLGEYYESKGKKEDGHTIEIIEAPRGVLFYDVLIKNKKVNYCKIKTPTEQMIPLYKKYIKKVVEDCLNKELDENSIVKEVSILLRSFDPCFSCSTKTIRIKNL